ncbi:unnamed protein product [Alopecurus aequalis]
MEPVTQGGDHVERGADDVATRGTTRRRRRTDEEERERALAWTRYEAENEEWQAEQAENERRNRQEQERWDKAPLEDMLALPLAQAGKTREQECPICFEDFLPGGEKLRTMDCSHSFHERCIFNWLVIDRRCPMCRSVLKSQKRRRLVEEKEQLGRGHQEPVAAAAGDADVGADSIDWVFIFDGSLPHNGISFD